MIQSPAKETKSSKVLIGNYHPPLKIKIPLSQFFLFSKAVPNANRPATDYFLSLLVVSLLMPQKRIPRHARKTPMPIGPVQ
jgi:hypothetical protein